jgi:formate hydrogenlyase transcriptional activator
MNNDNRSREELLSENEELRFRLEEAEETLNAIRSGAVDALVVSLSEGDQVFTLKGAEHPYRVLVETMNEGAATLAADGTIAYCNVGLVTMLNVPLEKLIGSALHGYVAPRDSRTLEFLLEKSARESCKGEIELVTGDGSALPVLLSCSKRDTGGTSGFNLVITDLSEQKRTEELLAEEKLARSIFQQAGESILVCDRNGRIIRTSRYVQQLCSEVPPLRHFDELLRLRMADGEGFFSILAPLQGEVFKNVAVEFRQKDDRSFKLLLNASPLKNDQGEILGSVVTLTNITHLGH